MAKTQQSQEPGGRRTRRSTAHWCTLSAALDETGWPWLRLRGELVAKRAAYQTYPEGVEIDWGDDTLLVDRAESTVRIWEREFDRSHQSGVVGLTYTKPVAVQVLLPVGQRPPAVAISRPWQPKPFPEKIEAAVKKIAEAHPAPDWLPFPDFWAKLEAQLGQKVTRRVASSALKYAPHLRGKRGQRRRKVKSSS